MFFSTCCLCCFSISSRDFQRLEYSYSNVPGRAKRGGSSRSLKTTNKHTIRYVMALWLYLHLNWQLQLHRKKILPKSKSELLTLDIWGSFVPVSLGDHLHHQTAPKVQQQQGEGTLILYKGTSMALHILQRHYFIHNFNFLYL